MQTQAYLQFGKWGGPYQTVSVEHKETEAPRHNSVSGYGSKIPTSHMIKYLNRWRRVYCVIWSNIGTCYAMVNGNKIVVTIN